MQVDLAGRQGTPRAYNSRAPWLPTPRSERPAPCEPLATPRVWCTRSRKPDGGPLGALPVPLQGPRPGWRRLPQLLEVEGPAAAAVLVLVLLLRVELPDSQSGHLLGLPGWRRLPQLLEVEGPAAAAVLVLVLVLRSGIRRSAALGVEYWRRGSPSSSSSASSRSLLLLLERPAAATGIPPAQVGTDGAGANGS